MAKSPAADERRIAPRLRPALGTVCRFDPFEEKAEPALGLVWNISLTGVSMLIGTAPKQDGILTGELALENGQPGLQVILRVIHVRPVPTGDFILGAAFLRALTQQELDAFLVPQ